MGAQRITGILDSEFNSYCFCISYQHLLTLLILDTLFMSFSISYYSTFLHADKNSTVSLDIFEVGTTFPSRTLWVYSPSPYLPRMLMNSGW